MTVAHSAGVFGSLGTDETTGVTIASASTTTSTEKDFLGDDTSFGRIRLYLKFTSTVTAGTMEVRLWGSRITAQDYGDLPPLAGIVAPINGTQKVDLGWWDVARFMKASVFNNGTGANATNVLLGYELFKMT
jgi:hypothetical protein